jgi:hypothetical protein
MEEGYEETAYFDTGSGPYSNVDPGILRAA